MSRRGSILAPQKWTWDHQGHPRGKPSVRSCFGLSPKIDFDTYFYLGPVFHLKLSKSFCLSSNPRHSFPLLRLFDPAAMEVPFPASPSLTELESFIREETLWRSWRKKTARNRVRLWGRLNLWSQRMKVQTIMSGIALICLAGMDLTHFVSNSMFL